MNALTAAVSIDTPVQAIVVGLALIAIGMLIQYRVQLEVDDRADARDQAAEADRDAIFDATGGVS